MAAERDRRDAQGYLKLEWLPGEAQVDFGEADFRVRGVVTRGKYLTVTFPHSNVGLTQVFWGEASECVCQGLRDVFEFVSGVPPQGGLRQRDRGRRARRGRGQVLGALPEVRGALRPRLHLHQPLPRQREGQRREQGRVPQEEPLRARARLPRRVCLQRAPPGRLPRRERRQAPLQAGHARARAVRRGQGCALAPAASGVLVREVGDQEVQQAGRLHGRRPAPLLGRPGRRAPRGRGRAGRLRRHGLRLRDRRGADLLRARVGRGAHGQLGPDASAEVAVHAPRGLEGLERQVLAALRARVLPGLGGPRGPRRRPQGAVRRERRAQLARRGGGHVALARGHRRRRPRVGGPVRGEGAGRRRARRVRGGGSTWASTTGRSGCSREVAVSVNLFFTRSVNKPCQSRKGSFTSSANAPSPIPTRPSRARPWAGPSACRTCPSS